MKTRLMTLCMFLLLLLSVPVLSSEEEIIQPNRTIIHADCGRSFGDVRVDMMLARDKQAFLIQGIVLTIAGANVKVPVKAFADLRNPQPKTMELRTEAGYDRHPWLYITFAADHVDKSGKGSARLVYLAWQNGRFVYRGLKHRRADGQWAFVRTALP